MIIGGIASCYNMIVLLFNRVTGFKVRGLFFDVEEERTRPIPCTRARTDCSDYCDQHRRTRGCGRVSNHGQAVDLTFKELGLCL